MHHKRLLAAIILSLACQAQAETLGASMGVYAFPEAGQSAEQASADDAQCYSWAIQQTGYDPLNPVEAETVEESGPQGHRLRGAARGAAGGAIIGEIADDDAGKGAAIGATLGTMRGGAQARQSQAAAQQQAGADAQAAQSAGLENLRSAYSACMGAKNYGV